MGINVVGTPCKIFVFNKLLALVEAARAVKILYTLFNLMITKSFTLDMSGSNP